MKQRSLVVLITLILLSLGLGCTAEEKKVELKDFKDKVSYSIGLNLGNDFKGQEVEVNADALAQGIKDSVAGGETMMTPEEVQKTIADFQKELGEKQQARVAKMSEENLKAGEAFLAENAKKEGVKTTESGLQYIVIEEGTGKKPTTNDAVTVHYTGRLIDGTEFDSSVKRGQPATFPVGGVIPGWTEALQLMKEGAKYQLFIPANLAYGERGAGPKIQPNSVLVFDVELIKVGQ